jgi:hypothetical protein
MMLRAAFFAKAAQTSPPLFLTLRPVEQAEAALFKLRHAMRTLAYADAETIIDEHGVTVVDLTKPPGTDESTFLNALLTAVCRQCLWLAPGLIVRGAQISGAGGGKGLAVRCICEIAYGRAPVVIAQTTAREELDKQISAALIGGAQCVIFDNFNNVTISSSVLASALTERPSRIRMLGKSQLISLNALSFISITGNAVLPAEDLIRRLLNMNIDARTEDPEQRKFISNILHDLRRERAELLTAGLTIWRYGRIHEKSIAEGKALGAYEDWTRWVRDPLLDLGCKDPVTRMETAKSLDPKRKKIAAIFSTWWREHGSAAVTANTLAPPVVRALDLTKQSRQYLAAAVARLAGTRINGFVLTRHQTAKWSPDLYVLKETGPHDFTADDAAGDERGWEQEWEPEP